MSPKTGRPPKENPKGFMLRVRIDEETLKDLNECASTLETSNSEVVRKGISLVKSEIQKK